MLHFFLVVMTFGLGLFTEKNNSVSGQVCDPEITLISSPTTANLSSPNFGYYDPNLNCSWSISASQGLAVELTITSFMLQDSPSCDADSVTIYDGNSTSAEVLIGPSCGTSIQWPVYPTSVVSSGNALFIMFTTDDSVGQEGFNMTFKEVSMREEFFLAVSETEGIIYKQNRLGQNYDTIVTGRFSPRTLGFDPVERKVYFSDTDNGRIGRIHLDGSNQETIATINVSNPRGLAVDHASRVLYWTDYVLSTISRSSLDGSNRTTLVSTNLRQPWAIAVLKQLGYIYWTDTGLNTIERSKEDGTARETIISTDIPMTKTLALDCYENKLYWADTIRNTIERSEFDGSHRELIKTGEGNFLPQVLVVLEEAIFWADFSTGEIHVSDRTFQYEGTPLRIEDRPLRGLVFYSSQDTTCVLSACFSIPCKNNGTCRDKGTEYVCDCPSGFTSINCTDAIGHFAELEERLRTIANKSSWTSEEVQEAIQVVVEATEDPEFIEKDPERIKLVINSLEVLINVGDNSVNVTEPVVHIVNNLMNIDGDVILNGTRHGGRVLAALEDQVTNAQTNEGNYSLTLKNLAVTAVKIDKEVLGSSLEFANVFTDSKTPAFNGDLRNTSGQLFANGGDIPVDRITASISVPATNFDSLDSADINLTEVPVSFFVYDNAVLFTPWKRTLNVLQGEDEDEANTAEVVVSQVISAVIEAGRRSITKRNAGSPYVRTKFRTFELDVNDTVEAKKCVFWDYDNNTGEGFWSTEGCNTVLEEESSHTVCSCDRLMGSFAILVRFRKGSHKDTVALYFISVIGSIISAICLVLCIITFVSLKAYRSRQATGVHIHLCSSLLGFYIVFLLSHLTTRDIILCSIASASIHFFCLATVAWMSVEAVLAYHLFVKMERNTIHYFIRVACVLAYGGSAGCAVLVALLDKSSPFNKTHQTHQSSIQNADYCFIHPGPALYLRFITEVVILFVLNVLMYISVVRNLLCRRIMVSQTRENARRNEIIIRVRHGIFFWFVLGLSWLFGFLAAADKITLIFHYLFCITIAIQGLVMFLLLCVANPEFRKVFIRHTRLATNRKSGGKLASSETNTESKLTAVRSKTEDSQSGIQMADSKN